MFEAFIRNPISCGYHFSNKKEPMIDIIIQVVLLYSWFPNYSKLIAKIQNTRAWFIESNQGNTP